MYKVKYEGNTLYLFEVVNGGFKRQSEWVNSIAPEWDDIIGTPRITNIQLDPSEKEEAFTEVIKHSLGITLIRVDEQQFTDIIQGIDNEWHAAIVRGGSIGCAPSGRPYVINDDEDNPARVLFVGTLTNETYGETLMHFAEVNITFHDKVGELGDLTFEPTLSSMPVTRLLAELLHTVPASNTMLLQWGYSYDHMGEDGDRADELLIDVAYFKGKKKLEVLKHFLSDFKLQLYVDFEVKYGTGFFGSPYLLDTGAVRIICVARHTEAIGDYFLYRKTKTVAGLQTIYDYEGEENGDVSTVQTFSQISLILNPANFTNVDPFIFLHVEYEGNRHYCVMQSSTLPSDYTQQELEAIGCVFPCQVYYSYTSSDKALGFRTFMTWINWLNLISGGFVVGRSQEPGSVYDVTIEAIDPRVITFADTTMYSENVNVTNYLFTETKKRYIMASQLNPIINRNGDYTLARRAKYLDAKLEFRVSDNLLYPPSLHIDDFTGTDGSYTLSYNYAIRKKLLTPTDIINYVAGLSLGTPAVGDVLPQEVVGINTLSEIANEYDFFTVFNPIRMVGSTNNLSLLLSAYTTIPAADNNVYIILAAVQGNQVRMYSYATSEWLMSSTILYLSARMLFGAGDETAEQEFILPQPFQSDEPYVLVPIVWSGNTPSFDKRIYITGLKVRLQTFQGMPRKLTLRTLLNESMRKPQEFSSEFCTLPDIDGAAGFYRNGLMTLTGRPLPTLLFRGLSQTLLAHASDQYGYNYSKERWLVNAEVQVDGIRLFNLYELDGRVLMLTGGSYDVRRDRLTGNFVEVADLPRLNGWLWEDDERIIWEDGDRILI